jgi:hypothetical protein
MLSVDMLIAAVPTKCDVLQIHNLAKNIDTDF